MPTQITAWKTDERGEIVESEPQAIYYELCFNYAKARSDFADAKLTIIQLMDELVGELGNQMIEAAKQYSDAHVRYRAASSAMHRFELSTRMDRIHKPNYESYGRQIPSTCPKCEDARSSRSSQ